MFFFISGRQHGSAELITTACSLYKLSPPPVPQDHQLPNHQKLLAIDHQSVRISGFPQIPLRRQELHPTAASSTQVSSSCTVACSNVPRLSTCSLTLLIEPSHHGLPGTPSPIRNVLGSRGQSVIGRHSCNLVRGNARVSPDLVSTARERRSLP